MAPLRFSGRTKTRAVAGSAQNTAKPSTTGLARPQSKPSLSSISKEEGLPALKRDKRMIKHSLIVSKARASARVEKPGSSKRRRPAKKLHAAQNLADLVASLPDAGPSESQKPSVSNSSRKPSASSSMSSRRGAQKRKDRISRLEQERFSQNLSILQPHSGPRAAASTAESNEITSHGDPEGGHWSSLRSHIMKILKP